MRKHSQARHNTDITSSRTFLGHIQLSWIMHRYPRIPVFALYNFLGGFFSIGLLTVFAVILHSPFIFPSLGPTAFYYFSRQTAPTASPRNAIIGHLIGTIAGYFSLVVTGLTTAGPVIASGATWPRVIAAALSLGLTAGLMILLHASHAPACATTLIISLGMLTRPWQFGVLMLAIILLTLQAIAINWLFGMPLPLWSPSTAPAKDVNGSDKD